MRKLAFCICKNKDPAVTAQLISVFVFATWIVQSLYCLYPNFKPLAIFCGCTARFVSDLVGNPEDQFSHNEAHMVHVLTANSIWKSFSEIRVMSGKLQLAGQFVSDLVGNPKDRFSLDAACIISYTTKPYK